MTADQSYMGMITFFIFEEKSHCPDSSVHIPQYAVFEVNKQKITFLVLTTA